MSLKEASDIALGLFSWDISAFYYQLGARFTLKLHPGHQRIALAILGPRSHAVNSAVGRDLSPATGEILGGSESG